MTTLHTTWCTHNTSTITNPHICSWVGLVDRTVQNPILLEFLGKLAERETLTKLYDQGSYLDPYSANDLDTDLPATGTLPHQEDTQPRESTPTQQEAHQSAPPQQNKMIKTPKATNHSNKRQPREEGQSVKQLSQKGKSVRASPPHMVGLQHNAKQSRTPGRN